MDEIYTQNQNNILDFVQDDSLDNISDLEESLSPVSSDALDQPQGESISDANDHTESDYIHIGNVSSGDSETDLSDVEAGHNETLVIQDTASDLIPYLEKINYSLTAIFWLLLFAFCFKRIRSGVKGFTGRGLND